MQDGGRFGYRKFGVPYSGAFDQESLLLANALLGNPPEEAAIEMPLMGGSFVSSVAATYACVGAPCNVLVGGKNVAGQSRFAVAVSESFQVMAEPGGVRRYLAVAGGFVFEPLLSSGSGIAVAAGSSLALRNPKLLGSARLAAAPESLGATELRYIVGPQAELFDLAAFAETDFEVDIRSDRKGVRLSTVFQIHETEILSEPALFGAIQVPPSGMPIILGPDGPTIGGYPKIGVVISADLNKVGQLGPGASVRFRQVSLEEAIEANRAEESRLRKLINSLQLIK